MLSTCCAVPAGQRVGPSLAGTRQPGHGEYAEKYPGPGRAAALQKWAVNPIVLLAHDLGIPSPGDALLETTGRTGLPQRSRGKGKLWGIE